MTDKQKALEWLYKQLKRKRIALRRAEGKPNIAQSEINDINSAIDTLDYIIVVVLCYEGSTKNIIDEIKEFAVQLKLELYKQGVAGECLDFIDQYVKAKTEGTE